MHHEPTPRHLSHRESTQHMADAVIADATRRAPTTAAAQAIADAYHRHGIAYAAYLTLTTQQHPERPGAAGRPPVEPDPSETAFTDAYVGYHPDRHSLITDTIASFGWEDTLDQLLRDEPLLRAVTTFDQHEVWGFIADHYDLIELDTGIYVFEQAP